MGIISIGNLETLAASGNADANYELGLRYYKGIGVGVNYKKAKTFFEEAVKQGCSAGSYYLGIMHYNGKGTPTNHVKAKEYFEKSDAENNIFSSFYLGKLYYWGDGVEKNYEKANEYKNKVLGKPFFGKQDIEINNFYSVEDFESTSREYASNLQKKVQSEFSSLFGNDIRKI